MIHYFYITYVIIIVYYVESTLFIFYFLFYWLKETNIYKRIKYKSTLWVFNLGNKIYKDTFAIIQTVFIFENCLIIKFILKSTMTFKVMKIYSFLAVRRARETFLRPPTIKMVCYLMKEWHRY